MLSLTKGSTLLFVLAFFAASTFAASPGMDSSDPLVAVDLNRTAIIADVAQRFKEQAPPGEIAKLREQLWKLRADRLLAISVTSSYASLRAMLEDSEDLSNLSNSIAKSLGDPSRDLVYTPLAPCRLIDTRGNGAPIAGGAFAPNARRSYAPNGLCNIPSSGVASILISVTTQNLTPGSGGYLAIVSPGAPVAATVDIFNLGSEWSASNTAVATGAGGQFDVFVSTATAQVVVDILGYFSPSQGGFVTSITAGAGLTGGTINSTGTIALAAAYQLPQACTANQVAKWNGTAWTCGADTNSGGTVTAVSASAPLASTGGSQPDISLIGTIAVPNGGTGQSTLPLNGVLYGQGGAAIGSAIGTTGQVLVGTTGQQPSWSGSPVLSGNLALPQPSTPTAGNLLKGALPFLHNFGAENTFLGITSGNFTLSGTNNTAIGVSTLFALSTGSFNTAAGFQALASNTAGNQNIAFGWTALVSNTAGSNNSAIGGNALTSNTVGNSNSAYGFGALNANTTGSNNIAIGNSAGHNLTTGDFNINIGNPGIAAEANTIRIGDANQTRTFITGIRGVSPSANNSLVVVVDSNGQLGTGGVQTAGTVTSITAGAGLAGGAITTAGTVSIAPAFQLPQLCSNGQVPESNGAGGWSCVTLTVPSGAVGAVTASNPLTSSGGLAPNISLSGQVSVTNGGTGRTTLEANGIVIGQGTGAVGTTVGTTGQVLVGTASSPAWSGSPSISGNLTLADSTSTTGNVMKGANSFIHTFGSGNTFLGESAGNFTMTGDGNTASGNGALSSNTTGVFNTASGRFSLTTNTTGTNNAAVGWRALSFNTSGSNNTATGASALQSNTIGESNTADGRGALFSNTTGVQNTATGDQALYNNSTGSSNTAYGAASLQLNTTGHSNSAFGNGSLVSNSVGFLNTAIGRSTLVNNSSGHHNIALGDQAGVNVTTGAFNILIGNSGNSGDTNVIRLGDASQTKTFIAGIRFTGTGVTDAVPVLIDSQGQLGTFNSSRRYKDDIADMDEASSGLMNLRPVTFHYKSDKNPQGRSLQYGLIAEEVAEVYPNLVAHTDDGQIQTVMYQYLPSMLLNEAQKQHRRITMQAARIAEVERQHQSLKIATAQIAAQQQVIEELQLDRKQLSRATAQIVELKSALADLGKVVDQLRTSENIAVSSRGH